MSLQHESLAEFGVWLVFGDDARMPSRVREGAAGPACACLGVAELAPSCE